MVGTDAFRVPVDSSCLPAALLRVCFGSAAWPDPQPGLDLRLPVHEVQQSLCQTEGDPGTLPPTAWRSSWLRRYVASSVCPACGTDYHERLRCISHLSDKRQPKCAVWIRAHVEPLPDAEVARLDAIDRVLRRAAWRQGHTHHIAVRPSIRPKTATRRGKHAVQSGA